MSDFAKIFAVEGVGQILVMQDTNDDGNPAINIYFQPTDLGICCMALSFKDDDDGWDKCDGAFGKMDEETALALVKSQLDLIQKSKIQAR